MSCKANGLRPIRLLECRGMLRPRANLRAQQVRFNDFRRVFNYERPHESAGDANALRPLQLLAAHLYRTS